MEQVKQYYQLATQWAGQNERWVAIGLILVVLVIGLFIVYRLGLQESRRRMRRLVKKNDAMTAERFVMQQAEDGAMEIRLTKKAYKALRGEPLQGAIIGQKNQMVLRIKVV